MLLFSQREFLSKLLYFSVALLQAFDLALKRLDETRNRHDDGNALPPDRIHKFGRPQGIEKNNGAGQQRRDKQSHHLTK
jgi:hypothetical protein